MKNTAFFLIILTATVFLSGCTLKGFPQNLDTKQAPVVSPLPTLISTTQPQQTTYEFTATQSGTVALELIQTQARVETKDYGEAGQFITNINGLAGDNSHYWAFYVNGAYAEAGASQTKLKKGDIIKFVYEEVSATK